MGDIRMSVTRFALQLLKRLARRSEPLLQADVPRILEQSAKLDPITARRRAERIRRSFGKRRFDDSTKLIRQDPKR